MKDLIRSFSNPALCRSIQYLKAAFFLSFVYSVTAAFFITQPEYWKFPAIIMSKACSLTAGIMICFSLGVGPLLKAYHRRSARTFSLPLPFSLKFPLRFQRYFAIFGWVAALIHVVLTSLVLKNSSYTGFEAVLWGLGFTSVIAGTIFLTQPEEVSHYKKKLRVLGSIALVAIAVHVVWVEIKNFHAVPALIVFMAAYTLRLRAKYSGVVIRASKQADT